MKKQKRQRARMTERRYKILKLIAKGFNNEQIAKEMELSLSNTKMQKWRLYVHLNVNKKDDAILIGLVKGYLDPKEIKVKNKKEIIRIFKEIKKNG